MNLMAYFIYNSGIWLHIFNFIHIFLKNWNMKITQWTIHPAPMQKHLCPYKYLKNNHGVITVKIRSLQSYKQRVKLKAFTLTKQASHLSIQFIMVSNILSSAAPIWLEWKPTATLALFCIRPKAPCINKPASTTNCLNAHSLQPHCPYIE